MVATSRESYHRTKGRRELHFQKLVDISRLLIKVFYLKESKVVIWGLNLILENLRSILDYSGWKNYSKYIHIPIFTIWFTSLINFFLLLVFLICMQQTPFVLQIRKLITRIVQLVKKMPKSQKPFHYLKIYIYIYKICPKATNGRLGWKVSWYKTVSKGTNFKSVVL